MPESVSVTELEIRYRPAFLGCLRVASESNGLQRRDDSDHLPEHHSDRNQSGKSTLDIGEAFSILSVFPLRFSTPVAFEYFLPGLSLTIDALHEAQVSSGKENAIYPRDVRHKHQSHHVILKQVYERRILIQDLCMCLIGLSLHAHESRFRCTSLLA